MTDYPRAALYVCGTSDINMQNASLAADMLAAALRDAGFCVGARTAFRITAAPFDAPILRDTLLHLAALNDLVITVGAVGFHDCDILPDVTDRLCAGRAEYFAGILCGAYPLPCRPEEMTPVSPTLPPFVPAAERRAKERRLSAAFSPWALFRRMLPPQRGDDSRSSRTTVGHTVPLRRLSHPSRASAGILRQTLFVNFPADVSDTRLLADALLPPLTFAVFRLCGKCAVKVTVCDGSVNNIS